MTTQTTTKFFKMIERLEHRRWAANVDHPTKGWIRRVYTSRSQARNATADTPFTGEELPYLGPND